MLVDKQIILKLDMLNNKFIGYGYNDVTIMPSPISTICHRSECVPTTKKFRGYLPIFTAPMSTVVDENNYTEFVDNDIIPIIPRNVDIETRKNLINSKRMTWVALSLSEFEQLFIKEKCEFVDSLYVFVCIDIANGHMKQLYSIIHDAKKIFYDKFHDGEHYMSVMMGNIANPHTIELISKFNLDCKQEFNDKGIDYVRVGIGGGDFCITSSNTGVHYPQASLIDKCHYNASVNSFAPYIIADGGIKNYSDVVKALALGADFVMIGSLFVQAYESAAPTMIERLDNDSIPHAYQFDNNLVTEDEKRDFIKNNHLFKIGYGMASKNAQALISKTTSTAEGIEKRKEVKYTLKQWTDNMKAYLQSAMSYCDCYNVEELWAKATCVINSSNEIQSVNK